MDAKRRLQKELQQIRLNNYEGIWVDLEDNNLFNWRCYINGPKETPYENGIFELGATFTKEYPFKAPKLHFRTKIFHSNISTTGEICVDILKNKWSPVQSIGSILISILSLLGDPNESDPINRDAGILYKKNKTRHDEIAKKYTEQYAKQK